MQTSLVTLHPQVLCQTLPPSGREAGNNVRGDKVREREGGKKDILLLPASNVAALID